MKRTYFPVVLLSIAFAGLLSAQETSPSEEGTAPESSAAVVDADNPGMGHLDQATEAKLRASTIQDLSQVIVLCQRAKRTGLTGENLKYCNQLLASSQLQRGLFLTRSLLEQPNNIRPANWQELRRRALVDLEESVSIIKDQPTAYLGIAQLNLLPEGDQDRAKEALQLVIQSAKDEPEIQFMAARLLASSESDIEKQEIVLAAAAQSGNPQIVLLHALVLIKLQRDDEAAVILKKLVESEHDDAELHERLIGILTESGKYELAMDVLNILREKGTNGEQKTRLNLVRAELLAKMDQYEEALTLLNTLYEQIRGGNIGRGNVELTLMTLLLRSDIYLAMDNPENALKDVETAETILPDLPPVLEKKYGILMEQKKFDEALALTKKLQSLIGRPQNFLREILVLNEMEKYDDSIEIAKELQEMFPEEESEWILVLVEIYSKQKAYDKALALVEEQLQDEPGELRWIVAKSKVLTMQKKLDEAVAWLETCLQKEPDSRAIRLTLLEVLYDQKNYKAVREHLRPLLETSPDDLILLHFDSQVSISLGLHSDAIKVLMKLVDTDPADSTSINNLAWVLCTSPLDSVRDGRRAVELAEKAGKLTRYKKAFILSTLAAAYAETGDFEKAREWAQKSVEAAKIEKSQTEEERQELLDHLQKEWDCYKQDMPFRELLEEGKP
jgi:tetratricopeptide (TPR) repeat protein